MWNDCKWLYEVHKTKEEGPISYLQYSPYESGEFLYVRKEDYGIWNTTVGHLHFPKELC